MHRSVSDASYLPSTSQPPSESQSQPMARSLSIGTTANPASAATESVATDRGPLPAASDAGGSHVEQLEGPHMGPHMRLGLRMHQRVAVQQHVKALQQQIDTAASDLQVRVLLHAYGQ